jgi:transaldolase
MLISETDGDYAKDILRKILKDEKDDTMAEVRLQRELVAKVAEVYMPLYESSHHTQGYVSIQGDPFHEDEETIVKCARFNREAAPNIMAKIPATPDGLKAIETLMAEGVPINATECMAIRQVLDVCEIYKRVSKEVEHMPVVYFSLITGIFDEYLAKYVKDQGIDISPDVLWQAGFSVAKKVHQIVAERKYNVGFIGGGARGLHHFTEMVGANASITINWKGTADKLLEQNAVVVDRFCAPTPLSVIDELTEKIDVYRKAYYINAIDPSEYEDYGPVVLFRTSFEDAWRNALNLIAEMRKEG